MRPAYPVDRYIEELRKSNDYFYTFISKQSLAAGVLVLAPGQKDTQEPHDSDEVYFVLRGDGFLRIGDRDYRVSANRAFFVRKDMPHFFYDNSEELAVLYFFGGPDR